jgi:hypothetical protein
MRRPELTLVVAVLSLASYACSSDSPPAGAPACNTLLNDGPTVTLRGSSAMAPVPAGGTVVDGVYELTAATLYGVVDVPLRTISAVFAISGTTMQQVGTIDGEEKRYTSTFGTKGTLITTIDSCPSGTTPSVHSFTATATELRVYDATVSESFEQTYTKR